MYNNDNGYTPNFPEDEEANVFNETDFGMPGLDKQDFEESSEPVSEDTTYHFSKKEDNLPFSGYGEDIGNQQIFDTTQLSNNEDKHIKPNYRYSESSQDFGSGKKKAGNGLVAKVAAVAIVCSLVFGTAGGYLGSRLNSGGSSSDTDAAAQTMNDVMKETGQEDIDNPSNIITNTSSVTGDILTATEIYELATKQVVSINCDGTTTYFGQTAATQSMGTGFVISEDGYIITNYHVISNAVGGGKITVGLKNGETYEAKLVGGYEAGDVALLKIEATGLPAVTLGDSNNITVGENIYVVGNALGEYDYTLTGGLVSGLDRLMSFTNESGASETINMFQIDAAVNSGNSGGPVYNSRGEVIGIVTSKISSGYSTNAASVEGLGFAIPVNDAISIVNDIQTKGYVEGNVLLNVNVRTVDSTVVESYGIPSGVYVDSVTEDGAAQAAGVAAKDIITKIDDTDLTSVSDLKQALKNYSVGDSAKLTVYRSGEYLELTVTFTQTETTDTSVSDQPDNSDNQYSEGNSDSYGYPDGYDNYGGNGNSDPFGGFFG